MLTSAHLLLQQCGVWGGGGWAEGEILVSPFHSVQTEISALDLTPGPPILGLKPFLLFFFNLFCWAGEMTQYSG